MARNLTTSPKSSQGGLVRIMIWAGAGALLLGAIALLAAVGAIVLIPVLALGAAIAGGLMVRKARHKGTTHGHD